MATRAIAIVKRSCKIGDIVEIDACLEETHTLNSTVTDHPVESGLNVSDHSRPDPDIVTLRCFVSNTPLSLDQTKSSIRSGDVDFETTAQERTEIGQVDGRGDKAFANLKKIRDEGKLIAVVTSLKTYGLTATEGMMIQSLSISRTTKNYDGLEFTITLKQVRIVANKDTQQSKQTEKNTRKKKDHGSKPAGKTPNEDPARTLGLGLR